MQARRTNPLLPIIGCAVLAIVVLVLQRACRDDSDEPVFLETVPRPEAPDADTPADTITTLTANVAAMTRELETLKADNATLIDDNRKLLKQRDSLGEEVSARMAVEFAQMREADANADTQTAERLEARLDALVASLATAPEPAGAEALPIGFGFDGEGLSTEIVWVEPLDAVEGANGLLGVRSQRAAFNTPAVVPRMTVPRNATLIGAKAMTALLGRVPIRGEVRDPMPFKVLTGTENLAANGYAIPGLAGMVWSGTAIGDWALACVRGELHSVTYVFADGRIRTVSSDEAGGEAGGSRRPLGWVSDARGIPCISGERKSNAAQYLSQRIGASAIEAAAKAAAAAQTQSVVQSTGAVTNAVDGDLGAYVLGHSAAEGGAEIARWLAERQAQEFDAVFVAAGAELVIHVDRELALDLDPNARRLEHAATPDPNIPSDLD